MRRLQRSIPSRKVIIVSAIAAILVPLLAMSVGLTNIFGSTSVSMAAMQVPKAGSSHAPQSTSLVISQVYGGGGNSGALYTNDFIEIFNPTSASVTFTNWSVQYAAATGNTWQVSVLTGTNTLAPGQYFLIQEARGAGGTQSLPTPDNIGSIPMSATAGKVALVNNSTMLTCTFPNCHNASGVVDFVGFGTTANDFEGAGPALAPSNTASDLRAAAGCTDADSNSTDFSIITPPTPRNTSSPFNPCGPVTPSPIPPTSTPGGPTATSTAIPPTATSSPIPPTATNTPLPRLIREIQGTQHLSLFNGQRVGNVPGIVTAKRSNGFYMQDPSPDVDNATSEGIFVFTSSAPTVNVGDSVQVTGTVSEFRNSATNLTVTELISPVISVSSSGNTLPTPVVIGTGGRIPPNTIIEDDASGDVETSGVFDPNQDGIDFYESLEGMRVQVNNPVAVGPTTSFGEIAVLADDGANSGVRTNRGGIVIQPTDFNPERIILDDSITTTPNVNVGDHFTGPAIGVMDYGFGNFKLQISQSLTAVSGGLAQEVTTPAGSNQIAIGNFNVENLAPGDPQSKYNALAALIINNLKSPDLISIEEIQDNTGATDDGIVAADQTWNKLILAIQTGGGPTYQYRQIDPVNDQDGGQPGGNIRQGFLFRTDRGLQFIDRPGGCSTCPDSVVGGSGGPTLAFSPGRIDPNNTAFTSSRKPLAGEFTFNGNKLFVIGNHFNSKGGDQPLFGHFQPPVRSSEVQRNQQATVVNGFVTNILNQDANANIVVLGDLNDFSFSSTLVTLKQGGVLNDMLETLPLSERYTYVFDGNSQDLDHTLVSNHLFNNAFTRPFAPAFDVVHVNSEFSPQTSDHDPQVLLLNLPVPCTVGPDYLTATSTGATPVPANSYVPGSTCNSCTVNITLPFTYTLYDAPYTTVNASNKGNLQFTTTNNSGNNTCLPASSLGAAILPYWDDLNTNINDTMGIYTSTTGTAPNRIFNIRWHAGYEASDATADFEVRLYEGQPKFDIIYSNVTMMGFSTTIGVQSADHIRFTQYECNTQNTVQNGMMLTFNRNVCPGTQPGQQKGFPNGSSQELTQKEPAMQSPECYTSGATQFSDMSNDSPYTSSAQCLSCRGIVSGYSDGTFRPSDTQTRGQLAKMVSNAAGFTDKLDYQVFQDVPSVNPFYQYVNRLYIRGYLSGYPCGAKETCGQGNKPYFHPSATATRGETARLVSRVACFTAAPGKQIFEDVTPTHPFYREIQTLAAQGIIGGYPCGGPGEACSDGKRPYFRPDSVVTRGQTVKILTNTFFPVDCAPRK